MKARSVHMIGIGGIGLSAIARILLGRGYVVSGSDRHASTITQSLERSGATVEIGHRTENVGNVDLVLVTSAVSADNPEVVEARRRGIPVLKRRAFFPELTSGKKTIAVAGTHGKTTTTGLIATILTRAGLDPSVVVGGMIPELAGNARAGGGDYFVIEADEYDRAFLGLTPHIALVTGIEMDHPDMFADVEAVGEAFREFMQRVPPGGTIVGCADSDLVQRLANGLEPKFVKYGLGPGNNWQATELAANSRGGMDWTIWNDRVRVGEFSSSIPGKHNVANALAAVIVACEVGIDIGTTRDVISSFRGAARRFEIKGEWDGITIVDDYAHHPSEIRATLAAARGRFPGRPIWAVFQPHTYSRTRALLDEFANAFTDADHVLVTEIFAAREQETYGTSGEQIVHKTNHPDARFIRDLPEVSRVLCERLASGDVLITLGAGDVDRVGSLVASALQGDAYV